jgi:hypothetical protein
VNDFKIAQVEEIQPVNEGDSIPQDGAEVFKPLPAKCTDKFPHDGGDYEEDDAASTVSSSSASSWLSTTTTSSSSSEIVPIYGFEATKDYFKQHRSLLGPFYEAYQQHLATRRKLKVEVEEATNHHPHR